MMYESPVSRTGVYLKKWVVVLLGHRLEICQKIYTTEILGQKFYTLKLRKLRLF